MTLLNPSSAQTLAQKFGVTASLISDLAPFGHWMGAILPTHGLKGADSKEATIAREQFLEAMGYIKGRVELARARGAAVRNHLAVQDCFYGMVEGLVSGQLKITQIVEGGESGLLAKHPQLKPSQARLLIQLLTHHERINQTNLEALKVLFPLPIEPHNYFGRFVVAGSDDPNRSVRHLQLSTPFFGKIRALIEGLRHPELRIFALDRLEEELPGKVDGDAPTRALGDRRVDLVHAAIRNAGDFSDRVSSTPATGFAAAQPRSTLSATSEPAGQLRLIPVPSVGSFNRDESLAVISQKERGQFAIQLYAWLLCGDRSGPLLTRRGLSEEDTQKLANLTRRLATTNKRHADLQRALDRGASRGMIAKLSSASIAATNRIEKIKEAREDLIDKRRKSISVLAELDRVANHPKLAKFREQLKTAIAAGERPILSFLKREGDTFEPFVQHLNRMLSSTHARSSKPGKILAQCGILLGPKLAVGLVSGSPGNSHDVMKLDRRAITFTHTDFNPSVDFILAPSLAKPVRGEISMLREHIVEEFDLPGVSTTQHLTTLLRSASGRQNPTAANYLEYCATRMTTLSRETLINTLELARQIGVKELPESFTTRAVDGFGHPRSIFEGFAVVSKHFKPALVGDVPSMFVNRADLNGYYSLGIDSLGAAPEVLQIQGHLVERGIVTVVDGTNYHPEYARQTDTGIVESDIEETGEPWGHYVRAPERVTRALIANLMQGQCTPALMHHTIVEIKKPDQVEKAQIAIIKKLLGIDIGSEPDLAAINQLMSDLAIYSDKVVIIIDAKTVRDMEAYREFLQILERYKFKVIIKAREGIPGIPEVLIRPIMDHQIAERLDGESEALRMRLRLDHPVSKEMLGFVTEQVKKFRLQGSDPLNLCLQVLASASQAARADRASKLETSHLVAAISQIFHLPNQNRTRHLIDAVKEFELRTPHALLGQEVPIGRVARRVRIHALGLGDPSRPVTLGLFGPTGVGKTEMAMNLARYMNEPFYPIDLSQFSEPHSVSRLVGSPPGYVGADEGPLYIFARDNPSGVVWIDEIEKGHPTVLLFLMNFLDTGTLTAGGGGRVFRPGLKIMLGSNKGADRLHHEMTADEISKLLAEEFRDPEGTKRPELIARIDPIPMLAIDAQSFARASDQALKAIGQRPGVLNANVELLGSTDAANELLISEAMQVCAYSEKGYLNSIGFDSEGRRGARLQDDLALYNNLRYLERAIEKLAGESLARVALEQYARGSVALTGEPRRMYLNVGTGENSGSLVLMDMPKSSTVRQTTTGKLGVPG